MTEQAPLLTKTTISYSVPHTNSNETTESKKSSVWSSLWASKSYIVLATIILATICTTIFMFSGKLLHSKHGKWGHHSFVNLEKKQSVSPKWEFKGELPEDSMIEVTMAVKQENVEELHKTLRDVSNPLSKNYGKHKTFQEVHDMLAPSEETLNAIDEFLSYHDVTVDDIVTETPNRDFIKMKIPVSKANEMFNTKYSTYRHTETGKEAIRVKDHYQIHEHLSDYIDYISPSIRLPIEGKLKSFEPVNTLDVEKLKSVSETGVSDYSSDYYIYPSKLWSLYHVPKTYTATSNVLQVVASFLSEWYDDSDLSTFWKYFGVKSTTTKRMPEYQPDGYGSEAELDVQYITSMGQSVDTLVWDIEDDNYFLTLLEQIMEYNIIPTVVSMSYGGDEQSNGEEYCVRGNTEFAKISLLGCTFFASSGDDGSVSSDGSLDENNMYTPSFPASSPYVTAVGGTYAGSIQKTSVGTNTKEIGWYNSGSGFSVFFDAEWYQLKAQHTFFERSLEKNELPSTSRFRENGAGYPDLAAQSVAYIICYEEGLYAVSGTSCSCPTVAGMFSLINDQRVSKGLSKLGWLNPTLYMLGYMDQNSYFNDVLSGYNEGYSGDNGVAFFAQEGWDAITGWGTPKWDQLSAALVNMDDTVDKLSKYHKKLKSTARGGQSSTGQNPADKKKQQTIRNHQE